MWTFAASGTLTESEVRWIIQALRGTHPDAVLGVENSCCGVVYPVVTSSVTSELLEERRHLPRFRRVRK